MHPIYDILNANALLSSSERTALASIAAQTGSGTIVELGTRFGGSASIMRKANPHCTIHTIDIADLIDPKVLDCDSVSFFYGWASEFAEQHPELKADFLFIDGYHSLLAVIRDFLQLKYLIPDGGLIAFHDVTPFWFGIFAFGKALIANGNISQIHRFDSLLIGSINHNAPLPSAKIFLETMSQLKHRAELETSVNMQTPNAAIELVNNNSGDVYCIGKGKMGHIIADAMGLNFDLFIDSKDASNPDAQYFIFSTYFNDIATFLRSEKGILDHNIFSWQHLIPKLISIHNFETINALCANYRYDPSCLNDFQQALKHPSHNVQQFLESSFLAANIFLQDIPILSSNRKGSSIGKT